MYVLLIVVCPFVLFLSAIVLSVPLRFTDSVYPFGIFKLFLSRCCFDLNVNDMSMFISIVQII